MVEATQSLPPHLSYVLITLARQSARNAVKQQLRDQGLKPQYMRASEINRAADLYPKEQARALLEEAWKKCKACPDLMNFYVTSLEWARWQHAKFWGTARRNEHGVSGATRARCSKRANCSLPCT